MKLSFIANYVVLNKLAESKINTLGPEHYIELVGKSSLLASILSNKDVSDVWHDSLEDAKKLSPKDKEALQSIPTNPKLIKTLDPVIIATGIAAYMAYLLSWWKVKSVLAYKPLAASAPLFVELSKYTPEINPDNKYKTAYRGTYIDEDELDDFIDKTDIKDWKKVSVKQAGITLMTRGTARYRLYTGPKNKQFTYKPHRDVTSWTVNPSVAASFGHHLLATPLDKTFFFDPSFMGNFGPSASEMETIRFGNDPMKVILLVNDQMFPFSKTPDYDIDKKIKYDKWHGLSENTQIDDEEGTLTMPI